MKMTKCLLSILMLLQVGIFASEHKKAMIFGVTGQDGAYLLELLLEKGYEVHGIKRRSSSFNTERVDHLYRDPHSKNCNFFLHYGDVSDAGSIYNLISKIQPDEIYNLAAQSHVRVSFDLPSYTSLVDGMGALWILDAIHSMGLQNKIRYYQASTSEMFGKVQAIPQSETTPFYPRSPYAVAKLYAHWITVNYRESYGMFACSGILFNHESPIRGETFLTRKVTRAVANIYHGSEDILYLGNLDAKRDWGYAKDYVYAMWLIMQQNSPDDYVIGTGETHSVREFVEMAFREIGINIVWQGEGLSEVGIDKKTSRVLVAIDPKYFRPTEVDLLLSDPSKAKSQLGWSPSVSFSGLVKLMVESDIELLRPTE